MRDLEGKELLQITDNGESDSGFVAIEATLAELAMKEVGVSSIVGNNVFLDIAKRYPVGGAMPVRGWYDPTGNKVYGSFIIKCDQQIIADTIREVLNGALVYCKSCKPLETPEGFWEFEFE